MVELDGETPFPVPCAEAHRGLCINTSTEGQRRRRNEE